VCVISRVCAGKLNTINALTLDDTCQSIKIKRLLCVCVCVCARVYKHECICECIYGCVCVSMGVCVYVMHV